MAGCRRLLGNDHCPTLFNKIPSTCFWLDSKRHFLARQQDLEWLYGETQGASQVFPEYYRQFVKGHNTETLAELLESYYQSLIGDNDLLQLSVAKQFYQWEERIAKLSSSQQNIQAQNSNQNQAHIKQQIASATLTCHYFTNSSFLYESQIISELAAMSDIPGFIIHGRYDMVCKPESAYTLSEHWPNSTLEIIPEAGHSCLETGTIDSLIRASERMAKFIQDAK